MFVEVLLWEGFVHGARLEDEGLAVVDARPATTTLAFRLDDDAVRTALSAMNEPLCDGMFLSLRPKTSTAQASVAVLFVEFKGTTIDRAFQQLGNAIDRFAKSVRPRSRTRGTRASTFATPLVGARRRIVGASRPT